MIKRYSTEEIYWDAEHGGNTLKIKWVKASDIEPLMCCGTCEHWGANDYDTGHWCTLTSSYEAIDNPSHRCDKWEMRKGGDDEV